MSCSPVPFPGGLGQSLAESSSSWAEYSVRRKALPVNKMRICPRRARECSATFRPPWRNTFCAGSAGLAICCLRYLECSAKLSQRYKTGSSDNLGQTRTTRAMAWKGQRRMDTAVWSGQQTAPQQGVETLLWHGLLTVPHSYVERSGDRSTTRRPLHNGGTTPVSRIPKDSWFLDIHSRSIKLLFQTIPVILDEQETAGFTTMWNRNAQ